MINKEEYIIKCMLVDTALRQDTIKKLTEKSFKDTKARKYFSVIKKLHESNIKIDILSLDREIKNEIEYITNLFDFEINKHTYIKLINDIYVEKVDTYLETYIERIQENRKKPIISTGFIQFNKKLGDGVFPGLYCIGGISSLGKTAFTLQLADNIAERGNDVLFFSLEMSKDELISRSLSRQMFLIGKETATKKKTNKYITFGTSTILRMQFGTETMHDFDLALTKYKDIAKNYRIVEGNFDFGVKEIENEIIRHIEIYGKKPVVFVDYLQVLKNAGNGNDKQEMDYNVTTLKKISRNFDIPVICVSSFNRTNYATQVSFESFKESGSIEYTADVLIGLQLTVLNELDLATEKQKQEAKALINSKKSSNPREITAVILKQRNGKAYERQTFEFFPINNYFEETGGC
jgi:replicative DNA helicase